MANIDLTTYRKDELAERDWMDPYAEFYLASEVDNLIADKDAEIAALKGEISKIQDKMCEDVFEGIMPSEHIVCRPLQQAAKRIAELKQSVSCDASVANYRKNLIKELEFKVDRLTQENRR